VVGEVVGEEEVLDTAHIPFCAAQAVEISGQPDFAGKQPHPENFQSVV